MSAAALMMTPATTLNGLAIWILFGRLRFDEITMTTDPTMEENPKTLEKVDAPLRLTGQLVSLVCSFLAPYSNSCKQKCSN